MQGSEEIQVLLEREYAHSQTPLYEQNEFLKIAVLSYYNEDDQWEVFSSPVFLTNTTKYPEKNTNNSFKYITSVVIFYNSLERYLFFAVEARIDLPSYLFWRKS